MSALRISGPTREGDHWTARVRLSATGEARTFHTRFGSWLTDRGDGDDWPAGVAMREAAPNVARALTARLPRRRRR